ncbi:HupE/UreJ family protein [Vibrio algicola]|uniref:Urease accessory protein UreJ n=1 Tax=Vibrio algicola TaxID=2662262 RepID=A0A5Q0TMX1_9VIBR|nr:HupE/UreJ family protein [Vibrio algicola]
MKFRLLTLSALFIAPAAFAHPGHTHHNALVEGILHPLTGLDHLVMLFGLGILISCIAATKSAAQYSSSKLKLSLGAAALVSLAIGLLVGSVVGAVSGVELMIAASIFVVALGIWNAFTSRESITKFLVTASIGLVFFHGFAHGVEATGSLTGFGAGMLISAAAIIFAGERLSHFIAHSALANKWLSGGIAASGVALMIAS